MEQQPDSGRQRRARGRPRKNPVPLKAGFDWVRDSARGRMVAILEQLLKISRREAGRINASSPDRLKWVNTVCYITQTYNSLLRDTDYDEMRAEMSRLEEKVVKIDREKSAQPQTIDGKSKPETG